MVSKRSSSNSPDWDDAAMHIVAFESIMKCRVVIEMTVEDRRGRADVVLTARAYRRCEERSEASHLASVSASTIGSGMGSLEGALIHVLYMLDAQLEDGKVKSILKT